MTADAWPRNVCTCLTEAPPADQRRGEEVPEAVRGHVDAGRLGRGSPAASSTASTAPAPPARPRTAARRAGMSRGERASSSMTTWPTGTDRRDAFDFSGATSPACIRCRSTRIGPTQEVDVGDLEAEQLADPQARAGQRDDQRPATGRRSQSATAATCSTVGIATSSSWSLGSRILRHGVLGITRSSTAAANTCAVTRRCCAPMPAESPFASSSLTKPWTRWAGPRRSCSHRATGAGAAAVRCRRSGACPRWRPGRPPSAPAYWRTVIRPAFGST